MLLLIKINANKYIEFSEIQGWKNEKIKVYFGFIFHSSRFLGLR
jgi:hypothetical protein